MNNGDLRLKLLNRTVLDLMNMIEDVNRIEFSKIDARLETACIEAIDSKNVARLNSIIKELEEFHSKHVNQEVSK